MRMVLRVFVNKEEQVPGGVVSGCDGRGWGGLRTKLQGRGRGGKVFAYNVTRMSVRWGW